MNAIVIYESLTGNTKKAAQLMRTELIRQGVDTTEGQHAALLVIVQELPADRHGRRHRPHRRQNPPPGKPRQKQHVIPSRPDVPHAGAKVLREYGQAARSGHVVAQHALVRRKHAAVATTKIEVQQTAMPGIDRVLRPDEVRGAASSGDPLLRAAALSYVPGRTGDLIVVPKPGWSFTPRGAAHGSATADDQQVPLMLIGRGIKPGRYDQPATPADIAPTLAALAGIALPRAEGRPLAYVMQK